MHDVMLEPQLVRMPEFGPGEWLNVSAPLTRQNFAERVTLVDFWDYTCVNCLRTLPYLEQWYERYEALGLTIVGVHAPEFRFARFAQPVRQAVQALGIRYPILMDNDFETWTRFAARAWPTKYLVDHRGYIRFQRQGEGSYHATESAIQALLRLREPSLSLPDVLPPLNDEDAAGAVCYRSTPELHAGYRTGGLFGSAFGNPEGYVTDAVMMYELPDPEDRSEGQFTVGGFWRAGPECIALAGETPGRVVIPYRAAGLNVVLSPTPDPLELLLELPRHKQVPLVEVLLDGRSLTHADAGPDISFAPDGRTFVHVDRPRLYALIRNPDFGVHEAELIFHARGLALYSITFETCLAADTGSSDEVFQRR